jgi:hypothetical protein
MIMCIIVEDIFMERLYPETIDEFEVAITLNDTTPSGQTKCISSGLCVPKLRQSPPQRAASMAGNIFINAVGQKSLGVP